LFSRGPVIPVLNKINKYLSLIKFSHTVFALPFAIIGFSLAIHSGKAQFSIQKLLLVLACMIFARSAAMAFNRYIDKTFDAKNPRTAIREIPAGKISANAALTFVIICSAAFVLCTWFINPLCFYLSPVALFVILGYSYTKRFTPLCHLILGVGLALAPVGAYIALTQEFALLPVLVGFLVLFWVSGFDIIYALQDEEFDRSQNLKSIPVYFGKRNALRLSELLHLFTAALVVFLYFSGNFNWMFLIGMVLFIGLLIYQHVLVKPNDLSRVNLAFATTNGVASVIFSIFACCDIFIL
jgi:4-hydroxybenzoate polyprenyltransferase